MAGKKIQTFADMVNLQVAAEAFLKETTNPDQLRRALIAGNKNNSREPNSIAQMFVDTATVVARYKLIAHVELTTNLEERVKEILDDKSGLSASLFLDTKDNQYTLSIRSTEVSANILDRADVFADVDIGTVGWAFGQIDSLESFWQYLQHEPAVNGARGVTTPSAADLQAFQEALQAGAKVNLTGFSLGGNIAGAFVEMH